MTIVDLSLPLSETMPVFPGDPKPRIEQVDDFGRDGWNMKRLHMSTHDGTHVNAQSHGVHNGRTLDDYPIESFMGDAILFESETPVGFPRMPAGCGLIFRDRNISRADLAWLRESRPGFIGLAVNHELDLAIEKELLKLDLIVYERLANTDLLPRKFFFWGVPLRIEDGDGSPVRAFAAF
jgi:arylformamidase